MHDFIYPSKEVQVGDSEVRKETLDNGLTVLLKEQHAAPVASFWVWYRVGSRNEVPGNTGISHWVEHMLFKGSAKFPRGAMDKAVSKHGGVYNGMTWVDWTTYYETLPSEHIELALEIESDRMVNALFDPQETETERGVIISEMEGNENEPEYQLYQETSAVAFRIHPYRQMVIGYREDLLRMGREDLYRHYRTFYTPNNAVVAAVGDFDSEEMLRKVNDYFGSIPKGPEPPSLHLTEPPQRGEKRVVVEGNEETAYLLALYHAPKANDPDFFPMVVADAILGGAKGLPPFGGSTSNRSSRLYQALVASGIAAAVRSSVAATVDPYLASIEITIRQGQSLEKAEKILDAVIQRLQEEPVGRDELEKAIKQSRAQFVYASESVTHQALWLGFSEIAANQEWLAGFLGRLSSVTAEDIMRVATKYYARRNRTVGWYVPQGGQA